MRTWDPVAAENGQSAFEPSQVGNASLGPERTRETEAGFDASALHGLLTISFSYYSSRTSGALVPVTLPPSLGFGARQLENIGVLQNHGSELSVNAQLLSRRNIDLSAGLQYTRVNSEAGDLGGQTITVDANSLSFVQQGLPAPSYIGDQGAGWSTAEAGRRLLFADEVRRLPRATSSCYSSRALRRY